MKRKGISCQLCRDKAAATILGGFYLCGGCALQVLQETSDLRTQPRNHRGARRKAAPDPHSATDGWQIP